jgi:hypothetical protein
MIFTLILLVEVIIISTGTCTFSMIFYSNRVLIVIWYQAAAVRREGGGDWSPHPFQRMAAGAVAGLLGQTASYPLDIVR